MHSLLLFLLSLIASTGEDQCGPCHGAATGRAIYFITKDEVNGVVALPIAKDGTLSPGTVTKAGGAGSVAVDGDGEPVTPDALYVFAVNAGSNTLSMLSISADDPTQLSLVGEPVAIPGEFPNTIAVSPRDNLACVGTTGAAAGISCGGVTSQGLGPMDALRPFDIGQSTPPVGPTNTVSQTFSGDESVLFTTVKGDPASNKTGFLSAFPVEHSGSGVASLSRVDVRNTPEGAAVLLGSQVIPGTSRVFATDASFGAAVLSVDPRTLEATTVGVGEIGDQMATCWATISPATGTAFVSDVAVNRVVEMSLADAGVVGELDLSENGDPGLIDLRASGGFVYALSPGNGTTAAAVTVLDVSGGSGSARMVQHFELADMAGRNSMGMAVLE